MSTYLGLISEPANWRKKKEKNWIIKIKLVHCGVVKTLFTVSHLVASESLFHVFRSVIKIKIKLSLISQGSTQERKNTTPKKNGNSFGQSLEIMESLEYRLKQTAITPKIITIINKRS